MTLHGIEEERNISEIRYIKCKIISLSSLKDFIAILCISELLIHVEKKPSQQKEIKVYINKRKKDNKTNR